MNKKISLLLAFTLVFSSLSGCAGQGASSSASTSAVSAAVSTASEETVSARQTAVTAQPETSSQSDSAAQASGLFSSRDLDPSYDAATAVSITLNGESASCDSAGVTVSGSVVTITAEGVYLLSGSLTNGQIVVDAPDTAKVQLVLSGASVNCDTSAAVYVKQADKTFLTLAEGSQNTLSNQSEFVAVDENSIDAVVFAKDDLTINGSGTLQVNAAYGHGVVGKDELTVTGGVLEITAAQHALSGKDCVNIADGSFTLVSGTDGIHSENKDDATRGSLYIGGGSFTVNAQGDCLDAATTLQIEDGTFSLTAGTGSEGTVSSDVSAKGLKSGGDLLVNGGSFQVDSTDDSVHTNGSMTVGGGTFTLASGDDGMHADATLTVSGGDITITRSYEGIEGNDVAINGGTISLVASDDGLNAAGGNDGSSLNGRPGQNGFAGGGNNSITITGGKVTVDASGDGIDSNGSLTISGGEVYVTGPAGGENSALDCDGTAVVNGGILIAVCGQSMMMTGPDSSSAQGSIIYGAGAQQTGEVVLSDSSGTLTSYTPARSYQYLILSAPGLQQGGTYTLTTGTEITEITLTESSYSNVTGGMGGGMGGGMRGGMGGMGGF